MPDNFRYVIEELITEKKEVLNKKAYYDEIINTIIEIGCADEFIIEMSNLIQQLVIDHLHIIGDIYDRGYGSHFVMDSLLNYHSLDIQWGNHDVLWMGASAGQLFVLQILFVQVFCMITYLYLKMVTVSV